MTLLGGEGLARLARINHARAQTMIDRLSQVPGVTCLNQAWFNEVALTLPKPGGQVIERLAERGVLGGVALERLYPGVDGLKNSILVAASELTEDEDIEVFAAQLAEVLA
jgi:glycine dehydrogenase subunit 1